QVGGEYLPRSARRLWSVTRELPFAALHVANVGAVDRIAVGRHVVDAQSNEIAAARFAVYGEVEEGQFASTPFQLQLGTDQPHVPGPERRLWTCYLALVPGTRSCMG